jgi:lysophospholipase L1-like esterase
MTRAAFFGSSTIAGKELPDQTTRFSTVASQVLGWHEINLGHVDSRLTGRDNCGRIVSATSGIARAPEVWQANADVVIILFGEEDFANSVLVGERRLGMGVDSVASVPAVMQERREGRRSAGHKLQRVARQAGGFDGSIPLMATQPSENEEVSRLIMRSLIGGAQALPGTFAGDFDATLTLLEDTLKPGQIYVMTPPRGPEGDVPNAFGLRLSDYCDAIRRIARQHEVVVLDSYHDSTITPSTYAQLSENGTDLSAEGHQRLAAFVIDKMARR